MRFVVAPLAVLLLAALFAFALASAGGAAPAEERSAQSTPATGPLLFDFKDPAEENAVALSIDSPLKPVVGTADGVSGIALFDPTKPEKTTGTIRVAVSSLRFTHPGYTATARGYGLEENEHPEITCELKKITRIKPSGENAFEGAVEVDFTLKGVTKRLTVPLSVRYLPGRAKERDGKMQPGDLLAVRSTFTVKRSDFNVAPDVPPAVCGDEVEVRVAVVGWTSRGPGKAALPKAEPTPAGKAASASPSAALDDRLPWIAERMRTHKVPATAVALIRDFQVVAVRHLGVTEAGGKQTIDPSTLFPAGAMGGPVAATVALRLAAEGRLDLDRDVNSYLKTWKVPGARTVTVRDLLTHRSGFRLGKYEGYAPNAPVPTLDQVLRGQAPARTPAAVPTGDAFALASENYTVLQKVIEDATGRPWAEVAQTSIAAPFGGQIRTRYAVLRPEAVGVRPALGHDDGGVILPDGGRAYPELAASGLWTNADEYADFLADVLRSASGREGLLLSADSARLLLAAAGENATVAFGSTEKGGTRYVYRGGNTAGYYCHLDADPGRGNAVVIFTNRNLCWQFYNEVRDALAKAEGWPGY